MKIDRSAFIYLPPKAPMHEFAQCSTCVLFIRDDERCVLFADGDRVIPEATCGLYLHGDPGGEQCMSICTPKQAGYLEGQVRCENCSWLSGGKCGLYEMLNKLKPDVFDLDESVHARGCCNAFQAKATP